MATKKVILTRKINDILYDIFPKTSADVVVYGETTVSATLAEFANALANVYTKTETDDAIKTSATNLYNKIMGITEEDGATVNEAYDTLKEVAAWIDEHGDIAAVFLSDITALKTAVGDENSGLIKAMADAQSAIQTNTDDIDALEAAVNDLESAMTDAQNAISALQTLTEEYGDRITQLESFVVGNNPAEGNGGLLGDMEDAKQAIQSNANDITVLQGESLDYENRISNLETTVGDDASGLVMRVNALEAVGATKTEASKTNGNIKIDGLETTVYTHPETHNATMIVEDDTHKFVTSEEKAIIASAAAVSFVQSTDDIDNERDLFLIEIE